MFRRLRARKITVEADSIKDRPGKQHQTGTHNARTYNADGNVVVTVNKQYPNNDDNPERPKVGSVHHGDSATISSRKNEYTGPALSSRRTRGIYTDNVIVDLSSKDGNGESSTKKKPKKNEKRL